MSDPKITAKEPLVIELEAETFYWCSCGASQNDPFCDGAHSDTEFSPVPFTLEDKKTVALCRCRATGNPPFCDGAHTEL